MNMENIINIRSKMAKISDKLEKLAKKINVENRYSMIAK